MNRRRTGLLSAAAVALLALAGQARQTSPPPQPRPASSQKKTEPAPPPPPANASWTEQTVTVPVLGKVPVYIPKKPVTNVVLFISGDGGWNLGVIDMARRIQPKAIVIGLSYVALRHAAGSGTKCWQPAGVLEEIAHAAEKQLKLAEYSPPLLVGYSSGATLVYGAIASAPPQTFAGGMSLGFCPDLPSNRPVCNADNFKPTFDAAKNTAWLPKMPSLAKDLYVLNGEQDQVCLPAETHAFVDGVKGLHFVEVPGSGHGFSKPIHWGAPFDQSLDALLASTKPATASRPAPAAAAALEQHLSGLGLPLQYVWSDAPRAALLFISGDGGWATIDDRVAAYLAARGVHVVGVSAVKYFWTKKTPQQTGADMGRAAAVLNTAGVPLFLGGYSFGAEVTPFVVDNWSDADRRNVHGAILIAPGETASFEVSVLDYVFRAKETPQRVADAVRKSGVATLCIAGAQEESRDTACDDLGTSAQAVRLPGSHHFNGDYDAVGKAVLDFILQKIK